MSHQLRKNSLGFTELFAQSIATLGPTSACALNAVFVYATAGKATALTFLIAVIGLFFVANNINRFALRSASPGSLYPQVGENFGLKAGFLTAAAECLAYLFSVVTAVAVLAIYLKPLATQYGIPFSDAGCYGLFLVLATLLALSEIKISAKMLLGMEFFSIGLIVLLAILTVVHFGWRDPEQLDVASFSFSGIRQGMVIAILSFVSFESATVLGREAKNPLKQIPRAINGALFSVGSLMLIVAYLQVLAFAQLNKPLDKSESPLIDIANAIGHSAIGQLLILGMAISVFSAAVGSLNGLARILLNLAEQKKLPQQLAEPSRFGAPYKAILLTSFLSLLIGIAMFCSGLTLLDAILAIATLASYGFIVSYIMISLTAFVNARRTSSSLPKYISPCLGLLIMALPTVGSFYPVPDGLTSWLPYLFAGLMSLLFFGMYRGSSHEKS